MPGLKDKSMSSATIDRLIINSPYTEPSRHWRYEREDGPTYNPMRAVVSFGPQHAPLEQRQVASALEEAQTLVPRPKLVIFAAFQFDPEAAKDIDETNWPGVTLLKAQMNADLIEAYRGTVSLPFEPGEHRRIAVKIVDDRGIESLKVLEVE